MGASTRSDQRISTSSGVHPHAKSNDATHPSIDEDGLSIDKPVRDQEQDQRAHILVRSRSLGARVDGARHGHLETCNVVGRQPRLADGVRTSRRRHLCDEQSGRDPIHADAKGQQLVRERRRGVPDCRLGVHVWERGACGGRILHRNMVIRVQQVV